MAGQGKPLIYLLHKDTLLNEKALPAFEDIKDRLHKVYNWTDCPRYVYVSHKWLTPDHPDDSLSTILSVLSLVVKTMRVIEYIWFDFSCGPTDTTESALFVSNLSNIISNSVRVLVIPFKSVGQEVAPIYDVKEFTTRAWCMLEASVFLKRPSKLRIAKISKSDDTFQLSMVNLPSRNVTDGISFLTEAYERVRDMVKTKEKGRFLESFHARNEADKEQIWAALVQMEAEIFSARRAESDFFVSRGQQPVSSSMKAVRGSNIYDQAVLKKLQTVREYEGKDHPCQACIIS
ncbi:unnamed protein product [Heterosigma akashiwo]